jgi:hypothetical protein
MVKGMRQQQQLVVVVLGVLGMVQETMIWERSLMKLGVGLRDG